MDLNATVTAIAANIPFFGLFWYALKRIETKDEQIATMNEKFDQMNKEWTHIVANNTAAFTDMKSSNAESTKAIEVLSDRIYDVLTNRNNGPTTHI